METSTTFLPKLKIKKLIPKAHIPTKGSDQAAGYDLYSSE
jgi:dUTPase